MCIVFQYVSFSKRFVPEVINFLCGVLFLALQKDPKKCELKYSMGQVEFTFSILWGVWTSFSFLWDMWIVGFSFLRDK